MKNNIERLQKQLEIANEFLEKYGNKFDTESGVLLTVADTVSVYVAARSAALAGEVFGREGWTRTIGYGRDSFDWNREIDEVKVCIYGAEQMDLNNSPVPAKAFPLQIQEA